MFDRAAGRSWNDDGQEMDVVLAHRASGNGDFRCISCGGEIAPVLAQLGSTRCHNCHHSGVLGDIASAARERAARVAVDALQELQRELYRSRRYNRPFTLISLPRPSNGGFEALVGLVRSIDRVWTENGSVYLLLPEANRAMGEALLERLERHDQVGLRRAEARLAAFPEDGLTTGALLEAVHSKKRGSAAADDPARPSGNGSMSVGEAVADASAQVE
jgi:hypothetical protein